MVRVIVKITRISGNGRTMSFVLEDSAGNRIELVNCHLLGYQDISECYHGGNGMTAYLGNVKYTAEDGTGHETASILYQIDCGTGCLVVDDETYLRIINNNR